ncbi:MAG TPA: hypothetical protein VEL11_15380 [Candidatus Bathyarchaeia archaeon]|nr:hypothetical protein [Candidatus Bathyarchaeia archaeon]
MSYAPLSRRPLLFKSFTGLEITEFDIISKEIESKYYEHEIKRLSNRTQRKIFFSNYATSLLNKFC